MPIKTLLKFYFLFAFSARLLSFIMSITCNILENGRNRTPKDSNLKFYCVRWGGLNYNNGVICVVDSTCICIYKHKKLQ